MAATKEHNTRPRRESLAKRLGREAERVRRRDGGACVYCRSTDHLGLDHLVPRSRGGRDEARNLAVACRRCNSARRNLPLRAWERTARARGIRFWAREVERRAASFASRRPAVR